MKIAYLSGSLIPSRGANSVHVMKMCQALSSLGHQVSLVAWAPRGHDGDPYGHYGVDRSFDLHAVRMPRIPGTGFLKLVASAYLRFLRGSRPELLYARHLEALAALAPLGIPMVLEAHNPPGSPLRNLLFRRILRSGNFRLLVVISDALRREYERLFPELRGRVTVAHDGADPMEEASAPVPDRVWPGDPALLQVGYVGQLYAGKGMEMVAEMARRGPPMDLHVVGGSDDEVARWKAKIATPDHRKARVWFHGHVPHGELRWYYDHCEVFVAPYQERVYGLESGKDLSRWMSPLKIFEYMATGKPIVCSDLPVIREVLDDGVNALLVPPGDGDAWLAALLRLRDDAALRSELGERARHDFLKHYTWKRRAESVLHQLPSTLGGDAAT